MLVDCIDNDLDRFAISFDENYIAAGIYINSINKFLYLIKFLNLIFFKIKLKIIREIKIRESLNI